MAVVAGLDVARLDAVRQPEIHFRLVVVVVDTVVCRQLVHVI